MTQPARVRAATRNKRVGHRAAPRRRSRPAPGPGRRTRCSPGRSRRSAHRSLDRANGDPVATSARPPDQRRMSAGCASAGRGRVRQRHDDRAIDARRPASRSAARRTCPASPSLRAGSVGRTPRTTTSREISTARRARLGRSGHGARACPARGRTARRGRARANRPGRWRPRASPGRRAVLDHREAEQAGDPDPRGACARRSRCAGRPAARPGLRIPASIAADDDGRGALDVVVERAGSAPGTGRGSGARCAS